MARERHEIKQTTNPGKHDFPCVIMGEVVDGGHDGGIVVAASEGMAMGTGDGRLGSWWPGQGDDWCVGQR